VVHQQSFHGLDVLADQRLVAVVVELLLGVHEFVHGAHVIVLGDLAGAQAAKLLHVAACAEQQAQVFTKRSHLGACFD